MKRALYTCPHCGALAGELHREDCRAWKPPLADDFCPECRGHGGEHAPDCTYQELPASLPCQVHYRSTQDAEQTEKPLEVANAVNIPLALQQRLIEGFLLDEFPVAVAAFIDAHKDELVDMAFDRLASGFKTYGSRMYGWTVEDRTQNALEEVADLLNYLSSGEVE